jgi:hypothetical protein
VRVGEVRLLNDGGVEARQRFREAAEAAQRHAQHVMDTRVARVDGQRLAQQVDPFRKPSLLTPDHCKTIEGIDILRLAPQHLTVAARGVGQGTPPMELCRLLQQGA